MDRIQFRRDALAQWSKINPVLLEGEVGFVLDDPNKYKVGDGIHAWNDLPLRGFNGNVANNVGDSEDSVISQKFASSLASTFDVSSSLPAREHKYYSSAWRRVSRDASAGEYDAPSTYQIGDKCNMPDDSTYSYEALEVVTGVPPYTKATDNKYNLSEAIAALPAILRRQGIHVGFIDYNNEFQIWESINSSFTSTAGWQQSDGKHLNKKLKNLENNLSNTKYYTIGESIVSSICQSIGLLDIEKYDASSFTKGIYIGEDGEELPFETAMTTDYIATNGKTILVSYIEQYASVVNTYYNSQKEIIGRGDMIRQSKNQYVSSIPKDIAYIRVSSLSFDKYPELYKGVLQPTFAICRANYSDKDIPIGKSNLLDIITTEERRIVDFNLTGYLNKNGNVIESNNFVLSDFIEIGLATMIFAKTSTFAFAVNVVEYDQDREVISYHTTQYTDLNKGEYSTGQIIVLNQNTRFIRVCSLIKEREFENVKYYPVEPYAVLFTIRDNNCIDSEIIVDESLFTTQGYIGSNGGVVVDYAKAKYTDYIEIGDYDYLEIKRLAAFANMHLALYSTPSEESFLISYGADYINTINKCPTISLSNAKYMRISNLFVDTTYMDKNIYSIKPYIILKKYTQQDNFADHYNKSYIGCEEYAVPENYDYSQIIVYGQSLAQGENSKAISTNIIPNAYMLGTTVRARDGELNPLRAVDYEFPVINAVNALQALYNKKRKSSPLSFVAYTGGQSGRCISAISKGTDVYTSFITGCSNTKNAVESQEKSIGCIAIIYMQGESDYSPLEADKDIYTNDKDEYKRRLLQLKNDIQKDIMEIYGQTEKPLFFVYQTSGRWIRTDAVGGSDNVDMPISMAQKELAEENSDVILISPAYPCTCYTDGHLSSNGYAWFGELIAKAIWQTLNKDIRFSNTLIEKVIKKSNKIILYCQVPVLPLKIDTHTLPLQTNYGFQVKENDTEININTINVYDNIIELILDRDIENVGNISVSYAGRYRDGRGNICDSDKWVCNSIYIDDTSDKGFNGNYTIKYRPYDENGDNIFGKKYPANNFLGNFYIEL